MKKDDRVEVVEATVESAKTAPTEVAVATEEAMG